MRPAPARPHSPADVFALAHSDPTVARHLAAWTSGAFASFEDMLISLVVELARNRADFAHRIDRYLLTLGR